jgi:hypothetical protein
VNHTLAKGPARKREIDMAKYAAVVKGGFFAQYSGTLGSIDVYASAKDHRIAAQNLAHKRNLEYRALVDSLVSNPIGTNVTVFYPEISASQELGGARPVVLTTIINRNTTNADKADIQETLTTLSSDTYTPFPPYNGDRNPLGTR